MEGKPTMKTMGISEFKAKCIEELKTVHDTGESLVVTLRKRPIATVGPYRETPRKRELGSLRGESDSGGAVGDVDLRVVAWVDCGHGIPLPRDSGGGVRLARRVPSGSRRPHPGRHGESSRLHCGNRGQPHPHLSSRVGARRAQVAPIPEGALRAALQPGQCLKLRPR